MRARLFSSGCRADLRARAWTRLNGLALVVGNYCRTLHSRRVLCSTPLILLTVIEWRRRMGIEPTWDFVEPHHGFEDQERHQVALRLPADESRCLRFAPQGLVSTCITRVTPPAFMKQAARYINWNTAIVRQTPCCLTPRQYTERCGYRKPRLLLDILYPGVQFFERFRLRAGSG